MIEFKYEPQILTCAFKDRLDSAISMEIDKQVSAKLDEISKEVDLKSVKVIFDLNGVEFIASAFIRICLQTAKTVTRENFSIRGTSPFVMKVFKMTGLDDDLNIS